MRAAIYNGPKRPISVEAWADPTLEPGDLLVEIAYCGVCGSDVSMTSGSPFDYPVGQCFGHEYAGTVVDLGRQVSGWKIGDKVACRPKQGCGHCEACQEGRLLLCPGGRGLSAGFAEYAAVPAAAAVRLPTSLSLADGALVEPMACGLRALRSADMRGGERVLVLGAGAMALSVVWWARTLGAAAVVVASRSAHRRETCLEFGADAFHSFDEDDPADLEAALGGAPHIVAECVGKPGMIELALDHVRMGGTVVSMGMCVRPEPILPVRATFKEARLTFPLAYSPEEFEEAARAFDARGFHPEAMVSHVLPLERLGAAMDALRAGEKMLKIHIDPRLSND
jgi:(R,R)-butanediol dehydrogenase/meso-butanediol dehydrogenase/diacetyl reductase